MGLELEVRGWVYIVFGWRGRGWLRLGLGCGVGQ